MPARLRDVAKALRSYGGDVSDTGGRHNYKATMPGFRVFPIPAHRGMHSEIPDVYIRGVCRAFGIDEAEFWAKLRGR